MNRQLEQDLPCVAVVGCGAAACEFFLPALRRHRDFQQRVLLVDQSPEQARAVAQQFGLQRTWTRYQEIPGEVEAVIIATPHRWHAEQALYFLERGKHVLVEKPLGMNSGEVSAILAAAQKHHVTIGVNNYRRLFPAYRRIQELLATRELGQILKIRVDDGTKFAWQSVSAFYLRDPSSRGVLLDRGAHTLDVLCWWLQDTPVVESAQADSIGYIEGLVELKLTCRNVPIEVKFSRFNRLENRYTITCERGILTGRLFDFAKFQQIRNGHTETVVVGQAQPHYVYAWQLLDGFLDAIRNGTAPPVSGSDVAASLQVIDAAYAALRPLERPWFTSDPNLEWLRLSREQGALLRANELNPSSDAGSSP